MRYTNLVTSPIRYLRHQKSIIEVGEFELSTPDGWKKSIHSHGTNREGILRTLAASPSEVALAHFCSTLEGLTENQAGDRLKAVGRNILSTKKPLTWWQLMLIVIPNPFNILLGLLAVISVATPPPTWSTFIVIMIMILISCAVRFWQEYKSGVAAIKLQSSISTDIHVRRRIQVQQELKSCEIIMDLKDIVPGDIVILNPGDSVPADCILLETSHLQIAQSSLTGESEPQQKTARVSPEKGNAAIFDLENVAYMGTSVISGSASALVVATGDGAFISSILKQLNQRRPISAFERGIRNVSYLMIGFMVVMVTIVLVINGELTHRWGSAALFSVSVAIGIVPEMLPAIINANLARGAFVLAKKKAIVKRLDAVQNLGSMTVLCSDKTGTLTKDEISLSQWEDSDGAESESVLQLAYTNAMYQSGKKNGIDAAIIREVERVTSKSTLLGERIDEIPFDFEKRRSSAIVRTSNDELILICKGAFEEILSLCEQVRLDDRVKSLNATRKHRILSRAHALNDDGYRVIAVATKQLKSFELDEDQISGDLASFMVFEGILTFLDPPKEDAAVSIEALQNLGVEVKVLTGDNLRIASKVCRSLNITGTDLEMGFETITGPELANLDSTEEFHEAVRNCTIFAKLTPTQKGEIIMSLKTESGHAVGMLGDGINDCVALRFADVGISVDTAVSVAKDCAEVIMTEKNLSIVVDGVRTGRIAHGNSIKYIKMVASSNFGNVFSVLIASAWLPFQPMTSLQILVQNLLYDVSQIALPWDRMDEEYLQKPQSWNMPDLLRFIVILGPLSSTIDMCTFCLGWFYYGIRTAHSPYVAMFHTHWFLEGLLTQTLIVHLLRTAKIPVIQACAAPVLVCSTLTIMAIGLVIPYIRPIAHALSLVRPANSFLGFLAAELALYCLEVHLVKITYIKIFKRWL